MKKTPRHAMLGAIAGAICSCGLYKSELDETLEWMDNTYNPHQGVSGSYGHARSAWYTRRGDKAELLSWG